MDTNLEILSQLYVVGAAVATEIGRTWAPTDYVLTGADFYMAQCDKPGTKVGHHRISPPNTTKYRNIRYMVDDYRRTGFFDVDISADNYGLHIPSYQVFWAIHKFEQLCGVGPKDKFKIQFTEINNKFIPKIMANLAETTLLKVYEEMKQKHHDAVLLFRSGDFYEIFKGDAVVAADILGITLTSRVDENGEHVDLAGFPERMLDTYLPKLVRAGKRVAIVESIEKPTKGVKRSTPQATEPQPKAEDEQPTATTPATATAEPAPTSEPTATVEPTLKDELRECALFQLPNGAEVVAAKYVPIGDDNGKWQMLLKMGDVYRYADIVGAARYLYINDRVFFNTTELAELMGMEIPTAATSDAAPTPTEEVPTDVAVVVEPEPQKAEPAEDKFADVKADVQMFVENYDCTDFDARLKAFALHDLRYMLTNQKSVTFKFRKKDGSERIAHGTLHADVIPEVKGNGGNASPKFLTYYDLDKQSWRCFEKFNIIEIVNE